MTSNCVLHVSSCLLCHFQGEEGFVELYEDSDCDEGAHAATTHKVGHHGVPNRRAGCIALMPCSGVALIFGFCFLHFYPLKGPCACFTGDLPWPHRKMRNPWTQAEPLCQHLPGIYKRCDRACLGWAFVGKPHSCWPLCVIFHSSQTVFSCPLQGNESFVEPCDNSDCDEPMPAAASNEVSYFVQSLTRVLYA